MAARKPTPAVPHESFVALTYGSAASGGTAARATDGSAHENEAADERRDGARAGAHRWRDSPESGGPLQRPPEGAGDTSRLMRAEQLSEAGSAAASGLTEAEARRLLKQRGPSRPPQTSRSYASIVRANVFTVFNLILAVFGVADARLRRLARRAVPRHPRRQHGDRDRPGGARQARARPAGARSSRRARHVVRDGHVARRARGRGGRRRPASRRRAGDQVVADGEVDAQRRPARRRVDPDRRVASRSRARRARRCAPARSSSRAAAAFTVTAVGDESYAERIVGRGARVPPPRSPLRAGGQPAAATSSSPSSSLLGGLLGCSLWHRQASINDAVSTSTAGVVTMMPEGLIAARQPHLRGRRGADGAPRRAGPAAERDRVARVGRHDLPGQDRHADRVEPARRRT